MRILLFSWILSIFLIQILYDLRVSGQCLDDQRQLLLQLKDSLKFNPNSSTKLVNWRDGVDCCTWDGVDCDPSSGQVIGLDLQNESISEGINNSTALFGLRYLQRLNLAFNIFYGTQIPKGLRNLTSLAYLNLSNAGFGGQVPDEVAAMTGLVVLDLSSMFQVVPPLKLENPNLQMLVQNLTGLRELHLDYVNISAQGSEWGQALSSSLPDLTTLSLRYCGLSGPLHPSLSRLRSLSVLRLEGNALATMVPDFFGKFSNLTTLILSNCFLQGTFPEMVFQVSTLQTLDLSNNRNLSGTIKEFRVDSSLRTMVLSYTSFTGPLPDSISNLKMLSKIDLSNCNFTGAIPSTITNLTELVYLDFSFNFFTGFIPPFHMSTKLTYLDLSRNSLSGPLSTKHFEGLVSLVNLNLVNNSLNGSIPLSLFALPSLQKLMLSDNKFSGQITAFTPSNLSNLDTLDLSSNHLEGPIPESFSKLEGLSVLSLSSNFFNGTVKLGFIRSLRNLTRLELGYNNLSIDMSSSNSVFSQFPMLSRLNLASCNLSEIPNLRNQSRMTFLDISNNHIQGEIPSWIWNIGEHLNLSYNFLVDLQKPFQMSPSLSVIDLHSNNLSGEFPMPPPSAIYVDYSSNKFQQPIPDTIGNFISFVSFFSLANNSFTGTVAASICTATYLQVLDLSANKLSGSIPPCLLENISNLGVLNLGRNLISGDIPDSFSVNCSLKTLDLSNNHLGGNIPPSLANCMSLEVMNVGNNRIDDTFPCKKINSSNLRVLVLRNNKFYGDLRCFMINGSWTNLQIIDIASNAFSGILYPGSIESWKGMVIDNNATTGSHLHYEFLNLNKFYYQDTVTVTIKGLQMELHKILTVFTAIDVSSNNFTGMIPESVGNLSSLYVLNLSHNAFTGRIPHSLGNLRDLGSLDLSVNQLTGEIPQELLNLTFLSFLNLSYNMLSGRIPSGSQFSTFLPESFAGNTLLCGLPLNSCDSDGPGGMPMRRFKRMEFDWLFIFTGLGYGVGASFILAPLAFCKQWRDQCNNHVDHFLKQIFPRYGFSYIRYDTKVEAIENITEEMTDDDEDDDDEDDDDEDDGDGLSRGRYCVFCTKLDTRIKTAIHNSNCRCHDSQTTFSTTSSSSSLLVVYSQNF